MGGPRRASVLFAEPDPSFVQLAALLSPTYAESMGPSTGGLPHWPRVELPAGTTIDDFVAEMHASYAGDGVDPEVRFAESRDELVEAGRDADVIVTERTPIDAAVLDEIGPRPRFVQRFGAWVPVVDVAAAAERGVMVATWRRGANRRVAEHAVLLVHALVRRLPAAQQAIRTFDPAAASGDGQPRTRYTNNWVNLEEVSSLGQRSLGIIGLGEVGSEVALLAGHLGMRVSYTQRRRNEQAEALLGIEHRELDELLADSDVVSLHLPLNETTEGFLSERELALMRPSSHLVNVSRGALVDEGALVEALRSGTIAGAAFDTFWREPLDPAHPLVEMDNVVLTPHVAAGAVDTGLLRAEYGGPLVNLARAVTRKLPFGVINMPPWPEARPEPPDPTGPHQPG